MALTRKEIQEYLYQLSSKKGFLTEQEIEKCCDENDVDLFDIDKIIQFLIDRKVLIQDENQINNPDDEEGYDRAQVDYDSIYKEILKRYPEQKYLIEGLKRTLPPLRNEWQTLVPQAKQGNLFARNRIISMYARNLFRSAYNFAISFGSDINNSFEDAVEGLIKALNSYDLTSPQPFPGYYPFYVYAAMQRNYEKLNTTYEIPNHHYQDMFSFLTTYKVLIEKHGIAIVGQNEKLVPADKKMYALRDVTGTVESIPLIASSIMSKKLATGSNCILLDVKCGNGAFMKNVENAKKLGSLMIAIGKKLGRKIAVEITNMEQPLGKAIGNKIEVIEAIDTLKGNGPKDFTEIIYSSAKTLLVLAQKAKDEDEAKLLVDSIISSGKAYQKFLE